MKILAVDYGDSRTGLATCDRTEFLTSPITPQITVKARDKVASRVCEVAKEIEAELIVIGLPLNMDGTEGERARKSRKLAKTVEIWSGLPVRMWDERQTTCAAADLLDESGTFGAKRKSILDSVSATVILDDYIQWRKEHPGEVCTPPPPLWQSFFAKSGQFVAKSAENRRFPVCFHNFPEPNLYSFPA